MGLIFLTGGGINISEDQSSNEETAQLIEGRREPQKETGRCGGVDMDEGTIVENEKDESGVYFDERK